MRNEVFLLTLALLFFAGLFLAFRYTLRARRLSGKSWMGLMNRLVEVNRESIAMVALDLVQEGGAVRIDESPQLSTEQVWQLVGGMQGLEKIEANCRTFIEIAVYVQQTYPEALVLAEELRRNTRHIQWHIDRLRASEQTGNLKANFAAYAQRAVATYYLMARELVALCESNGLPSRKLRAVA